MKLSGSRSTTSRKLITKAAADFKKVSDRVDAQVARSLASAGRRRLIRALPVIDAFASPIKIQQFTINDIDRLQLQVRDAIRPLRRPATRHRPPAYPRKPDALSKEGSVHEERPGRPRISDRRVGKSRMGRRMQTRPRLRRYCQDPNPHNITAVDVKSVLTPSRISEFAAHPRRDLFVGSNSKHPAEKFGCSSCHYGQGAVPASPTRRTAPITPRREGQGRLQGTEPHGTSDVAAPLHRGVSQVPSRGHDHRHQ